jgi:hypothetical protein
MRAFRVAPAWIVWGLLAGVAVAICFTYSRIPADQLYHVSNSGAAGGFGRALVFLNFSSALVALPFAVLAAERARGRRTVVVASVVSAVLCAVVFWPGVVDEADLDPRPINAPAALGVALALVVTVASGLWRERADVNPIVALFAGLLLVLALPWIGAELGFFLDGVPALRWLFRTGAPYEGLPSVHHGHHHGMDGVLLALAALATVPLVRRTATRSIRVAVGIYVGLELVYGLANVANDAWFEQVVKRGWVHTTIPSVLHPTVSFAWLGILLAAGLVAAAVLRRSPARRSSLPASGQRPPRKSRT